jgi:hypothetical protein
MKRDRIDNRESFSTLIPCGNLNLMIMENIKEIERGRENEWRLGFHPHSAYVHRATSLLIFSLYNILYEYNVL